MAQSRILVGIFLFSFSSLAYEITLTRIFSISLWYHFAFMVISIAMLGIGAGGTALSLYPGLKVTAENEPVSSRIGLFGLLLGGSIVVSYLVSNRIPFDPVRLSWDRIQVFYICLYYMVLSVPFFFFGLGISTAFCSLSRMSARLYGSDLLGAGTGSIIVLCLMSIISPEHVVVIVSSAALAGAFLNGGRRTRMVCALLILFNMSLLFMPALLGTRMSSYKGLQLAMQYPGAERIGTYYSPFSRVDMFRSAAVRFAPGLSLRYLDALPGQIGMSVDGGEVNAITDARKKDALKFLEHLPAALPYALGSRKDVLILEPKGGLEVLLARQYGAGNIFKIDSDPLVMELIRRKFGEFSGRIYDDTTWAGIGRAWLKTRGERFDLIDLSMTGASPSGSFGIAEDYSLTVEAFREYLGHLKNDGVISLHLFILPPPRVELRLLNTVVTAMEGMGIREARRNIIALRSWGTICILAKMNPFRPEELETARSFSKELRFDLVYLPGIEKHETNIYVKMPSNEYFEAFGSILDPAVRRSFQRNYIFDIVPVHDENPFFHYYLKLENFKKIYKVMGEKWQYFIEEGYLLPVVFIQVLLLSIVLILLPAIVRTKTKNEVERKSRSILNIDLLYFAFLGIGFMFVEIPLIQKMILPLGNTYYAVAAVLTSVLIGSGAGSLSSSRYSIMRTRGIIVFLPILITAYSIFLPWISGLISGYPLASKLVCTFLFLIPLSFFMGIPFPLGIRNLGENDQGMIPRAWAINGCLSVLAPLISTMVAMAAGFKVVLWIGAMMYLFAFLTFPSSTTRRDTARPL